MSSRPPPPPPIHSRVIPSSTMATIQQPPLGPHALPTSAILTSPYSGGHSSGYILPFSLPVPRQRQIGPPSNHPPPQTSSISQYSLSRPSTHNTKRSWTSAVPLERLLQTEPYHSSHPKTPTSPRVYPQFSPPRNTHSEPSVHTYTERPLEVHTRQNYTHSPQRCSHRDEYRPTASSPIPASSVSHYSPEQQQETPRQSTSTYSVLPEHSSQLDHATMAAQPMQHR